MVKQFTEDDILDALYGSTVHVATADRLYYLSYDGATARNPFTVKIYTHGPVTVTGVITNGHLQAVVEADETNILLLRLV